MYTETHLVLGRFILLMNTSSLGFFFFFLHLGFLEKKERGGRVTVFSAPRSGRDGWVSGDPFRTPGRGSGGPRVLPSLPPSYGSPTALPSGRCLEEDYPLLQPILGI